MFSANISDGRILMSTKGSHVAQSLYRQGYFVRIVDIVEQNKLLSPIADEVMMGNLFDPTDCARAVHGMHVVFHFAAQMGGMGTIHSGNEQQIYMENHSMTLNILIASTSSSSSVSTFFYASSACVYPDALQQPNKQDVSLRESDVYAYSISPQGLYGLEKFVSELLISAHARRSNHPLSVRIARFHNVYGPHGSFMDGREKVPAALLRKAHALSMCSRGSGDLKMEIWGDGTQRRSFLYIDDAVEAVLRLVRSDLTEPVNIGSNHSVTIEELANIALKSAGLKPETVEFQYDLAKETGVASRNSNNDFIKAQLDWSPSVSLDDGMMRTGRWIREALEKSDTLHRDSFLLDMQRSRLTSLAKDVVTFAILLPVTSRGMGSPEDCVAALGLFVNSLIRTTWRDTHSWGTIRYGFKIFIAIDHDDVFLLGENAAMNKVEEVFVQHGVRADCISTLIVKHPRGNICALWRDSAFAAWKDECDYFVLMGDDVELMDEGWMRDIHSDFLGLSRSHDLPHGVGCVAFTDVSFPGMPTFPVIHRTHLDIFDGQIIPGIFVNQDGDPFLFQLYRRFGVSTMSSRRICNGIGGGAAARYDKISAPEWTFGTLDSAAASVNRWLSSKGLSDRQLLTIDIIVPSYRVDLQRLRPILSLPSAPTAATSFIVIVDNPFAAGLPHLQTEFSHRSDVRIRVNNTNQGVSATRNRGLSESAAEWVLFLDDDVQPSADILIQLERAIRANPQTAGLVGSSMFPPADHVFTAAVHLSGVTYFWDIANKLEGRIPWGVTANLASKRVHDGISFDPTFPKTGGGEDIDYCIKRAELSIASGGEGFLGAPEVVVTHPWWLEGRRSYSRFFGWARGDGALVKMYPALSYYDLAPNSGELLVFAAILAISEFGLALKAQSYQQLHILSIRIVIATIISNLLHDLYRHLRPDSLEKRKFKTTLRGSMWILAILDSTLIRLASEIGRTAGMLERGEVTHFMKRFDWFTGLAGTGPKNTERRNSLQRFVLIITLLLAFRL